MSEIASKQEIEAIDSLVRARKYAEANQMCKEMIEFYPLDAAVWRSLAFRYSHEGIYPPAIEAMNEAIRLEPLEPAYTYTRAGLYLKNHNYSASLEDCQKTLDLCVYHNSIYYTDAANFFKAECLLQLGHPDKALEIVSIVPDDVRNWYHGRLRTKFDIANDCHVRLGLPPLKAPTP